MLELLLQILTPHPDAILALLPFLGLAGGILGAIGGGQPDEKKEVETSRLILDPSSGLERGAQNLIGTQIDQLDRLVRQQGPGASDVGAAVAAQRQLADQFRLASEGGGLPSSADITQTAGIARQIFEPEQVALRQRFRGAEEAAGREAARLGRSTTDPILQAKLRRGQLEEEERLAAAQRSFGTQLALQQPERRLGFAQQRAGILGGLATQALQNRQALFALGQQASGAERAFRLNTATREVTRTKSSGGGLGGGISGFLAGAGKIIGLEK